MLDFCLITSCGRESWKLVDAPLLDRIHQIVFESLDVVDLVLVVDLPVYLVKGFDSEGIHEVCSSFDSRGLNSFC